MENAVLVTDASQRKSVPIIRTLGKKGISVVAGESSHLAMGFFSKYCAKTVVYPAPEQEEAFVQWLIQSADSGLFRILFPIDERTMEPVTKNLERLQGHMVVPVVDHAKYLMAHDKARTMEIAGRLNIPAPQTVLIETDRDILPKLENAPVPAVIKPREGSGSRGIAYVRARSELISSYMKVHEKHPFPLVQEYVPNGGSTFGVEAICDHGSVLRTFVHRRIREFPIHGGPSTLRESYRREDIVEHAAVLLKALEWHGVAMVEFKEHPAKKKCYLMEINPKFWGSIALPISAGVDFPYLLYQMSQGIELGHDPGYQEHILCRWLLPGDVLHFLANPDRFRLNPGFFEFRGMHYDLIDKGDIGPLIGMGLSFLSMGLRKDFWIKKIFR